jgi:hypothetical protein
LCRALSASSPTQLLADEAKLRLLEGRPAFSSPAQGGKRDDVAMLDALYQASAPMPSAAHGYHENPADLDTYARHLYALTRRYLASLEGWAAPPSRSATSRRWRRCLQAWRIQCRCPANTSSTWAMAKHSNSASDSRGGRPIRRGPIT